MVPDPSTLDDKSFPSLQAARPATMLPRKGHVPAVKHTAGIAIIAAMINAPGEETQNEWVTLANFSPTDLDLFGWSLTDNSGTVRSLAGTVFSGETIKFCNLSSSETRSGATLNNRRGELLLRDTSGVVVDHVKWATREKSIKEGIPLAFHALEADLPPVRIIAALINAPGNERVNEWINVINLGHETVDLMGWALSDNTHHKPWKLDGTVLDPGQSKKFSSMFVSESGSSVQLGNYRGTISLLNSNGDVMDKVSYESEKKYSEGVPLTFLLGKEVAVDGFGDVCSKDAGNVELSAVRKPKEVAHEEIFEPTAPEAKIQIINPPTDKSVVQEVIQSDPPALDENNFPSVAAARQAIPLPIKPDISEVVHTSGIAIIAAMVNAEGDEIENEWVTLANFSPHEIDITGWALSSCHPDRAPRGLTGKILSGETVRIMELFDPLSKTGVMLNNRRGKLELLDDQGVVVDRVEWTTRELRIKEGVPVVFHALDADLPPVRIIAALVNAPGDERVNEWVTVSNLGRDVVDLKGWTLSDNTHHKPWPLDGFILEPGQSKRFSAMFESENGRSVQLGNRKGTIILRDNEGGVADIVAYSSEKKFSVGIPLTFVLEDEVAMSGFKDQALTETRRIPEGDNIIDKESNTESTTSVEPSKVGPSAAPVLDEVNFPAIARAAQPLPKNLTHEVTHLSGVAIIAAMVNAEGDETENEWVTVANFSPKELNLTGWSLSDTERPARVLSGTLESGKTLRVINLYNKVDKIGVILNNRRGKLELIDEQGRVVDLVQWTTREQRIKEGVPVSFHALEKSLPPVRIIAALVNAPGDERINEWVTVSNLGQDEVSLSGWTLSDNTHHKPWPLGDVVLSPGESHRFSAMFESESGRSVQLGNRRGTIVLTNEDGKVIDKVTYKSEKKFKVGIPLTFLLEGDIASDGFGDLPV